MEREAAMKRMTKTSKFAPAFRRVEVNFLPHLDWTKPVSITPAIPVELLIAAERERQRQQHRHFAGSLLCAER